MCVLQTLLLLLHSDSVKRGSSRELTHYRPFFPFGLLLESLEIGAFLLYETIIKKYDKRTYPDV